MCSWGDMEMNEVVLLLSQPSSLTLHTNTHTPTPIHIQVIKEVHWHMDDMDKQVRTHVCIIFIHASFSYVHHFHICIIFIHASFSYY